VDKMEIKNNKIHWEIKGKKFKTPLLHEVKARTGKVVDERPVMELDIEFNGRLYDKVKVSPVDRTELSSPFLVNRTLMNRMGVKINPDREFILTQPVDGYEKNKTKLGYSKAKGDPHAGIKIK
jgi:hypothetical protein